MLFQVRVDLLVSCFHLVFQLFLRIGLRENSRLLEFDLQLD